MMKKRLMSLLVLLITAVFLVGCGGDGSAGASGDKAKIGVALATTGPAGQTASWVLDGHQYAVDKINADGGVQIGDESFELELVHYDTEGRTATATSVTERLISQDKVAAILGTSISSETQAIIPISQRAKVPLVTVAASSDTLVEQGSEFFSQAGPANVNYVEGGTKTLKDLGAERTAILYIDDDWGQSYSRLYPEELESQGIEVVSNEGFSPEQKEFVTLLNKVKALNPDSIIVAAQTEIAVPLFKQIETVMPDVQVFEAGGVIPEELLALEPEIAEGMIVMSRAGEETPGIAEVQEGFAENHDYEANSFTYSGIDGVYIIKEAMERAGSVTDSVKIAEEIRASQYEGLIGYYEFTEEGENGLVGNRAVIKDGQVIYQSTDSELP